MSSDELAPRFIRVMPSLRECRLLATSSGNATVVTVDRRTGIAASTDRATLVPSSRSAAAHDGPDESRYECPHPLREGDERQHHGQDPAPLPARERGPGESEQQARIDRMSDPSVRPAGDQLMMDLDGRQRAPVTTEINARPRPRSTGQGASAPRPAHTRSPTARGQDAQSEPGHRHERTGQERARAAQERQAQQARQRGLAAGRDFHVGIAPSARHLCLTQGPARRMRDESIVPAG